MHFKNVIIELTLLQNGSKGIRIQYKLKKYHVHDEQNNIKIKMHVPILHTIFNLIGKLNIYHN